MEGLDAIVQSLVRLVQHPVETVVIFVVVGVIVYALEKAAQHRKPDSEPERRE